MTRVRQSAGWRWIGWSLCLIAAILVSRFGLPDLIAQTPPTRPSALKTFLSPDGAFQLKYSDSLIRCKPDGPLKDSSAELSCTANFPLCDDDAIVCLAYPRDEYRGYNFSGASFSLTVLEDATTELKCLTDVDHGQQHSVRPVGVFCLRFAERSRSRTQDTASAYWHRWNIKEDRGALSSTVGGSPAIQRAPGMFAPRMYKDRIGILHVNIVVHSRSNSAVYSPHHFHRYKPQLAASLCLHCPRPATTSERPPPHA
jgi:hypothetical protein